MNSLFVIVQLFVKNKPPFCWVARWDIAVKGVFLGAKVAILFLIAKRSDLFFRGNERNWRKQVVSLFKQKTIHSDWLEANSCFFCF